MKPIELFVLLSNTKSRDEFIKILRENRIKPQASILKKESMRRKPIQH